MPSKLSVNINKIATLRNARGGTMPNVLGMALDIEKMGVKGITIHPRPDERHIRYTDARDLKKYLRTELNIEGNPKEPAFHDLVASLRPTQLTLVPDAKQDLTSSKGWDCEKEADYLKATMGFFKNLGIRVSLFIDPDIKQVAAAKILGADAVELYTQAYAEGFLENKNEAIVPYLESAKAAKAQGLRLHAGHDLSLENSAFLHASIPSLDEVSIGHALICEALYLGLGETIARYRKIWG